MKDVGRVPREDILYIGFDVVGNVRDSLEFFKMGNFAYFDKSVDPYRLDIKFYRSPVKGDI